MKKCIGLFGTCGSSLWRDPFIAKYNRLGINFFNPNVADWKPELAEIEAEHLADDGIILFPVTHETYGTGSLAEVGFSILQAIRLDDRRSFCVLIDKTLDEALMTSNPQLAKESLRSRALVLQHLKKLRLPNVYLTTNLDQMLMVSLKLYQSLELTWELQQFNPHNT